MTWLPFELKLLKILSCVQKVLLILKGLIDKTQRNSGEKDKEKEEERERIKRPEKKEKGESPREAEKQREVKGY